MFSSFDMLWLTHKQNFRQALIAAYSPEARGRSERAPGTYHSPSRQWKKDRPSYPGSAAAWTSSCASNIQAVDTEIDIDGLGRRLRTSDTGDRSRSRSTPCRDVEQVDLQGNRDRGGWPNNRIKAKIDVSVAA